MKKYKKLICLCLAAIQLFGFVGCVKDENTVDDEKTGEVSDEAPERDYCRIDGKDLYFLDAETLESLREPLIKLLANREEEYCEKGKDVQYLPPDPDSPSVAYGFRCGLFDFTCDGIPELVAEPYGYSGSSGSTIFYVYDVFTGEHIETVGGSVDGNICLYYSLKHNNIALLNMSNSQCGHSEQSLSYYSQIYDPVQKQYVDDFWISRYDLLTYEIGFDNPMIIESTLYVEGEIAEWDEYQFKFGEFLANYIRIPETELNLIWIADLDDGDRHTIAKEITELLLSSGQKYIIPNINTVKVGAEELCLTKNN